MNEKDDLDWQKTEESDSLNKSVKPDRTYMDEYNLCKLCHGKRQVCERTDCPQRL